MYAFVLVHFGDKPKYLELEIYSALMLKDNTKYDIIYIQLMIHLKNLLIL